MAVLIGACSRAPSVSHVAPDHAIAGDVVHVWGKRLDTPVEASLVNDAGVSVVLREISARDAEHVAMRLPVTTPPGTWDLAVQLGSTSLVLSAALVVDEVSATSVCQTDVVSNTRVSLVAGEVRVERFSELVGEEVETTPIARIRHVELDTPTVEPPCAVVWLRLKDGRRVAFDQARTHPLRSRAQRLSSELSVPFVHLQGTAVDSAADAGE